MKKLRSLILAAHGSQAAPDSNQPLFDLAQRISELDIQSHSQTFDVVTPAFLMGEPEMTNVFEWLAQSSEIPSGDVVIVPVMTSQGYYLKKLPAKFAENQNIGDYRISMSPVLGVHPSLRSRIADQITGLLSQFKLDPGQTTVAIIGHGTRRNATSGKSTFELTDHLTQMFSESGLTFTTGFLDQDPTADLVASKIETPNTLIVPFLISRGPHTTDDVPNAFGLPSGPQLKFPVVQTLDQKTCVYAPPLATYPGVEELCLELAIEALQNGEPLSIGNPQPSARANDTAEVGESHTGFQSNGASS